ncbi:MAG: GGDEF domain-containing protein [Burkholderiales bacterium]
MAVTLLQTMRRMDSTRDGAAKTPSRMAPGLPAGSTDYYRRIEEYARRIRATRDVDHIVGILDEALHDTRALTSDRPDPAAEAKLLRADQEIQALKAELERTVALTHIDPLTELLNRRGLESSFVAEAARSDRHGSPLCAALIDIDDFKRINDIYGHPAGDAALTHFTRFLRSALRPNDVLARVGGEEFMMLLPDSNEAAAFVALSRLLKSVSEHPVSVSNGQCQITFTASVTQRAFGEPQQVIYERLDETLVRAKHSGKNRVMFAQH